MYKITDSADQLLHYG